VLKKKTCENVKNPKPVDGCKIELKTPLQKIFSFTVFLPLNALLAKDLQDVLI
jgi:hypothetical protein